MTEAVYCPICIQAMPDDGLVRVSLEFNVAIHGSRWLRLRPRAAELLHLLTVNPGVNGKDFLAQAIGGANPLADDCLTQWVRLLRQQIQPLGLAVKTYYARGYELEVPDSEQSAAA